VHEAFEGPTPVIGIAYGGHTPSFLRRHPEAVDYVEVPFELLEHDPAVLEVRASKPIVLHCASMSIAGSVPPPAETVSAIRRWIGETGTPWLGEHLSFITADRRIAGPGADEYAPGEPFNIGYTVHPPMNDEAVETVLEAVERCRQSFDVPLLLENPPFYFPVPGSDMEQIEFVGRIAGRAPDLGLLLDLTHFLITSRNVGFDPVETICRYPLERVIEVHVSGVDEQEGIHWDNHATRAPDVVFEMLAKVLPRAPVRAITLEYNWSSRFPVETLLEEIARTRDVIARAAGAQAGA
jgi:uncharacterized protein